MYHDVYEQSDLPEILSRIDVVVIPPLFAETFCLVLSGDWMAGLPVAVSDIGALGEPVADGVEGKKFRIEDARSLIDTLSWFLDDSWRLWNIQKPQTFAHMAGGYNNLYQSFLS